MACLDLLVQKAASGYAEHSRRKKHEGKSTLRSAYGSGQRSQFYQKPLNVKLCNISGLMLYYFVVYVFCPLFSPHSIEYV